MGNISERLQYLMDLKKINQVDAAKGMKIDRSRFNLLLNGKVAKPRRDTLQKVSSFFRCDINWLADGSGEPFSTTQRTTTESQPATFSQHNETFPMKEMVSMAMEILESDTEYKPALATNIRVFHQAVTTENEMNHVQKELEEMKEQMERLEQMLLSLGAKLPEKRDRAANS